MLSRSWNVGESWKEPDPSARRRVADVSVRVTARGNVQPEGRTVSLLFEATAHTLEMSFYPPSFLACFSARASPPSSATRCQASVLVRAQATARPWQSFDGI